VNPPNLDRRDVLLGLGAAAGLAACGATDDADTGKIGVAVLGIGDLSLNTIIPAIQDSANCRLTGLVSSSTEKLSEVGNRFAVPASGQYLYGDLERIADNPDIDFVYVAVPNALHAEFSIRAAQAGKHVLCEKPLAVSVEQCEAMIAASAAAGKHLAVNYRFQFDPRYIEMQRFAREKVFGMATLVRASIGLPLRREDWRLSRDLSGGLLMEQGVYAVSTACDLAGEQPVEVVAYEAKSDRERFADVEESIFWSMQFPSGAVAQCATSYTVRMNELRVDAVSGYFELDPAYARTGLKGRSTAGPISGADVDLFVLQLEEFATSVRNGVAPTRGLAADGLRDVKVMSAIHEALRRGGSVRIA
jgi:predicted dehydrogenase